MFHSFAIESTPKDSNQKYDSIDLYHEKKDIIKRSLQETLRLYQTVLANIIQSAGDSTNADNLM